MKKKSPSKRKLNSKRKIWFILAISILVIISFSFFYSPVRDHLFVGKAGTLLKDSPLVTDKDSLGDPVGNVETICGDNLDNDNDGFIDCLDSDCIGASIGSTTCCELDGSCNIGECNVDFNICTFCSDTDGGTNYNTQGTTSDWSTGLFSLPEQFPTGSGTDYCANSELLVEYYCEDIYSVSLREEHLCPYGCREGACLGEGVCYRCIGEMVEISCPAADSAYYND
jgi:hypothetical protein